MKFMFFTFIKWNLTCFTSYSNVSMFPVGAPLSTRTPKEHVLALTI